MGDLHWKTAITKIEPNEIRLRGYRIDELMGQVGFASATWLALMGELPSEEIGELIDAILVSSIDHGPTPPSVLAALTVASGGASIEPCLAGGLLAISKSHGGAVEACMKTLYDGVKRAEARKPVSDIAVEILAEFKESGKRISGYGHRIHTRDPRKDRLFELADKAGVRGKHIELAQAFEDELAKKGKSIPLNVDGAIAACLCELGVPTFLANSFFLVARAVGIIAHIHEERERYKPMRRIDPVDFEYDGPPDRSL